MAEDIFYLCNKQVLGGSLVGDHLLFRDFETYGIIFMNLCVITIAMLMLLRDYGIIFLTVYLLI
jgi:hypothetical protein